MSSWQQSAEVRSVMLGRPLEVPAPSFTVEECKAIAADPFGIDVAEIKTFPYASECDQLFHLLAADGAEFTMRISNPAQEPDGLEFQNLAIDYANARDPALPIPRLVRSRSGKSIHFHAVGADVYGIRVLTYLRGKPILGVMTTAALRRNLGTAIARFDVAMQGFSHPKPNPGMIWDIRNAGAVGRLDFDIPDTDEGNLLIAAFARFERGVMPALPSLRTQVIHNDFNPKNILVDPSRPNQVCGIIDFGDMIDGPLVFEPAVAASKLVLDLVDMKLFDHVDPITVCCDLFAGYADVLRLEPAEIALLLDLIIVRLAMRVAIRAWRAKRNPREALDPAVLNSGAIALSRLLALDAGAVASRFHDATLPRVQ